MNKKIYGLTIAAVVAAVVTAVAYAENPKRKLKRNIEKVGGLGHYNFAAGIAKRKGLIEGDAKIVSIEEINSMNKEQVKLSATIIGLIKAGAVSVGPQRDEKGHFIKTEKEGE